MTEMLKQARKEFDDTDGTSARAEAYITKMQTKAVSVVLGDYDTAAPRFFNQALSAVISAHYDELMAEVLEIVKKREKDAHIGYLKAVMAEVC